MEYTTKFDEMKRICFIYVKGRHERPRDSLVLQQFARDFGEKHACQKFLFDMTKTEILAGTYDTFQTGTVPVDPDLEQTLQKIALLYASNLSDHKFMETVAVNRGYNLRVFDKYDAAIDWFNTGDNA